MNRSELSEFLGISPFAGPGREPVASVVGLLRQASCVLDTLWCSSLLGEAFETAIPLSEADHCVHRALIALSDVQSVSPSEARSVLA